MNNRKSFLTAIIIVALICISIFYLVSSKNNVSAFPYSEGNTYYFRFLTDNPKLYCIDYNKDFMGGDFECYDSGNVDPILAYIVAQQTDMSRDGKYDEEANAIWYYYTGYGPYLSTDTSKEGWKLFQEAKAVTSVTIKDSGNISLYGFTEGQMLAPDSNGKYGPFRVDYPTDTNGNLVGNLVISVNGKPLTTLPASGDNFYLTEADGIKPGAENSITVDYRGYQYKGTYAKFAPIGSNAGGQDLIYVEPNVKPIPEQISRKFQAGKPNIIIDLLKKDANGGSGLAGAIFTVGVNNGTIVSGVNSATELTTVAGGNRIEIKPDSNATDVEVVIREKQAPDGFIKIEKDLVIYYTWDATKNMWTETHRFDDYDSQLKKTSEEKTNNGSRVFYTKLELENRRMIKIDFHKALKDGTRIAGAKFKVEIDSGATFKFEDGTTGNEFTTNDSNNNVILIEPKVGITKFKITFTEIEAPAGYAIIEEPIIIEYETKDGGKTWDYSFIKDANTEEEITMGPGNDNSSFILTVENRRKIIVDLLKTDTDGQKIQGVQFDLNVTNGKLENTSSPIVTDENGKAHIEIIPDSTSDVTLTLKETSNKYYVDMPDIEIKFIYRNGAWETDSSSYLNGKASISYNTNTKTFELTVKNQAKIENIKLIKVNKYDTTERIPGIEFTVTLENAVFESNGTNTISRIPTNNNGEIELGTILIEAPSKPVKITLTEDAAPIGGDVNYERLDKPVVITVIHKDSTSVTTDNSAVSATYNTQNNEIEVTIENKVTLNISGRVWEDIPENEGKLAEKANGIREDNEPAMQGITVKVNGNNFEMQKKTQADGTYIFEDLPASLNGTISYTIEFSYDGINYIAVEKHAPGSTPENDSDVDEIERDKFNNKFYTIEKDVAISKDGTERTTLTYNHIDDGKTAILNTNSIEFQIDAKADGTYSKNTEHIDMGLQKKIVDLAAVTEINSAKVSINGKTISYGYDDISALNKDENGYPIIEGKQNNNAEYNLYLYESDYNYRIGDYGLPNNRSGVLGIKNTDNKLLAGKAGGELEVELTYQILLNNQSATPATINSIAYYYDASLRTIQGTDAGTVELDGREYKKIIIPVNVTLGLAEQKPLGITFEVDKDMGNALKTGLIRNWVEIISYSTDYGCVDKDSAPDNIKENISMSKHEDDTDDAAGLNIRVQNDVIRTINGNVFNDINKDGFNNEENNKISDVIVQLIEIKEVEGDKLEYIWQETVTGSKTVKALALDGRSIGTYSVDNSNGDYHFEGFIPGNYIVRFIYGDNEYYDTAIDKNNIEIFNGQDYQSTKLPEAAYDKLVFNDGYFATNSSMARDNEARRLEVMESDISHNAEYSSIEEKLKNTWMCAETAYIRVAVSDGVKENNEQVGRIRNINFGLMERPQASLEIEKHITNLTVDGIVNATANVNNEEVVTSNGMVEFAHQEGNINATTTNKNDNRIGKWIVQTDIGNLAGKPMAITYKYLIKNVGDVEHVGNKLDMNNMSNSINAAKNNQYTMAYKIEDLTLDSADVTLGDYVGTSYYTNNTTKDAIVKIDVKVEDYLARSGNNQLTLDNTAQFTTDGATVEKYVWSQNATVATEKNIEVLKKEGISLAGKEQSFDQTVRLSSNSGLNTTGNNNDFTFRSYAVQLIGDTISKTGRKINGIKAAVANDVKVQSYADTSVVYIDKNKEGAGSQVFAAEPNEFVGETVVLTINTGGTDPEETSTQANILKIAIITATSMALISVAVVQIRKIAIKNK